MRKMLCYCYIQRDISYMSGAFEELYQYNNCFVLIDLDQTFPNFQYGPNARNKMDAYMPAGRNLSTKIVLLIHGGGWSAGSKEDMAGFVSYYQWLFPQHAIVIYELPPGNRPESWFS